MRERSVISRRILLVIAAAAMALAGPLAGPVLAQVAGDPVTVGVLHNESFAFATMMRNSYTMAMEEINAGGGINGRPLELVFADDKGLVKPGETAVKDLGRQGAVLLLGGYSSSNTVYMAGMAQKLDLPFLVVTAADDRVTQRGWANIYRLNPPSSGYTRGLEDLFRNKVRPGSISIVYENSPYGTGGALRMMWFCRENDIDIIRIVPYHKERTNSEYIGRILAPLKNDRPDVIYMISYLQDALALVNEIRKLGIESLLVGGAGGFTHPDFVAKGRSSAESVLTATLWHQELPYPGTRRYFDQYRERYGSNPDYHGAEAYSGLMVAADALRRARRLDPAAIRAALDATDLNTPFGPVRFSSYEMFERQNSLPTQVLQVIQGEFESVWPADLATAPLKLPPSWKGAAGQ